MCFSILVQYKQVMRMLRTSKSVNLMKNNILKLMPFIRGARLNGNEAMLNIKWSHFEQWESIQYISHPVCVLGAGWWLSNVLNIQNPMMKSEASGLKYFTGISIVAHFYFYTFYYFCFSYLGWNLAADVN